MIAALVGALVAVSAMAAYDSIRYAVGAPDPSERAVDTPLGEFKVNPSWIIAGHPVFKGVETLRSADGKTISGLWSCDGPTTFVWHFGADETVHLLEGEVHVEYEGKSFTIRPGETATFHAYTTAIWHIPKYAKKTYTLNVPSLLVRAWRRAANVLDGDA